MLYFITGLLLLAAGYFCYGKLVERLIGPDDRPVPSKTRFDGVDFLPLPHWKNTFRKPKQQPKSCTKIFRTTKMSCTTISIPTTIPTGF